MEKKLYLNRFFVGSDGTVSKSKTGKAYKPQLCEGTAKCSYTEKIGGKRVHKAFSIAAVVYKLFVDSKYDGRIFHKDGNPYNNAVENLIPSYTVREEWQIAEYKKWAYASAKYAMGRMGINEQMGATICDDIIQDSVFLMWKYLSKLRKGTKFSTWAYRYCKIAVLNTYKREKADWENIKTHI